MIRTALPSLKSFITSTCPHTRSLWTPASLNPVPWFQKQLEQRDRVGEDEASRKAAIESSQAQGTDSVFPRPQSRSRALSKPKATHHKYSTANFKIGPRKLGLLAKQITGKPIDYAILQMEFSQKRASGRVKSTLALARDHAVSYKNLQLDKLVVAQSWVTKGPKYLPHIDIKGRGRRGIKHHPDARLHVRLEEGKTYEEKVQALRERRLKAIRSAGVVREDMKLRNVAPIWAW